MTVLEYNPSLKFIHYLITKTKFSWQIETAYLGNVVGNLVSTFTFNLAYISFITAILGRFNTFAGYTIGEMLIFTLIGQMSFYGTGYISGPSATEFSRSVKSGNFDMLLIKPISAFMQVMSIKIQPLSTIIYSIPSFSLYIFLIHKGDYFHPTLIGTTLAILSLIIGLIFSHFYRFAVVMTIFKIRQNKSLVKTIDILGRLGEFPYEAYSPFLRFIVSLFTPNFLAAAVPALYILNRSTSAVPLLILIGATLISFIFTIIQWKNGLKIYESASS